MKTKWLQIVLILLIPGLLVLAYAGCSVTPDPDPDPLPSWNVVGTAGFSAGGADYVSLFVDNGTPYVAYRDNSTTPVDKATVMKYNGTSWEAVGGTVGISDWTVDYTSLFVYNGMPYVAYSDKGFTPDGRATVRKYDGSSWVDVGTTGFSANAVEYTSLFVDSEIPYVAYRDAFTVAATVMKFDGSWGVVGTADFSASEVLYTSLYVDSGGTPYVAYRDYGSLAPDWKANVMKFDGAIWDDVPDDLAFPGFSAGAVEYTSLFVYSGTPYVAYKDNSTSPAGKATVMKFNGTSWEAVGTVGFSEDQADYTSLYVDNNGIPYVAYKDNSTTPAGKAMVMKFNGTSWEAVGGTAGISDGVVDYTSLFVYNGTPYVAYKDVFNGNKVTVMKFD